MNVAAPTPDSPEAEALRSAQRAHEPSMEEILASIRAIIADDREPAAPKPGPQIVYSSDAPRPTPLVADPAPPPTVVWTREAPPPSPELAAPPPDFEPSEPSEEPLMSEETEDEIALSFKTLAESMAAHGREVAGEMAREMLRPMLKAWIDDNLPSMVERLVRSEIQRITRGRR
jgi:uncharacterized protein